MDERTFERHFRAVYKERLEHLGFAYRGDFRFAEGDERLTKSLQFYPIWSYLRRRFEFDFSAGVRHLQVERILRPDRLGEGLSTVARGLKSPGRRETLGYWHLEDPECVDEVLQEIQQRALPFLARFSDLGEVRRALESSSVPPFLIHPTDVVWLLAAIVAVQGERARAIGMLDQAIEERRDARPKHWGHLKELRERLAALPE